MANALRDLAAGVFHRQWVHQAVPVPLTRALIAVRARRAWQRPAVREQATRQMRFLLGRSSRSAEVEALARAYVEQAFLRGEYRWRPGLTTRHPIEGMARVHAAAAQSRGVIVNFVHHGVLGASASLGRAGFRVHTPLWDGLFDESTPSQRQWRTVIGTYTTIFRATGSYPHMKDILGEGEILVMSHDVPGSLPMTFLGRRVGVASGTARLALDTGAVILPITAHRGAGRVQTLRIEQPIDPGRFGSAEALQAEIARRHEPAVLAWPEAVENPLRRWNPLDPEDIEEFWLSPEERDKLLL